MESFWKNKRVVAYVALTHHTRFIIPVMEAIAAQGATVEYLVAQAERSQEITAMESGIPYSHIFDYIGNSDRDEIHENYMKLRNTFAKALLEDTIFSLQMTTVLDKTLFATAQEYVGFKNYLGANDVDLCIALQELNRWGKVFAFQAKKQNVPFLTFQEGLYTTATSYYNFTMTGHAQYSTLNLVWGKSTKDWLTEYEAPKDKIIISGNTHIHNEIRRSETEKIRELKRQAYSCEHHVVVLLLSSIMIKPAEELLPLLSVVKEKKDLKLFIKFHPGTLQPTVEKWMFQIPADIRERIHFIHDQENTYHLMAMSDLCVLPEGSTTGLEALAFGKPIVELDLPSPNQYDFSLADEKAALKMTADALKQALISNADFPSMIDLASVQKYIDHELYDTEHTIQNVLDIMQLTIQSNQTDALEPLNPQTDEAMDWSIIMPVTNHPETFLTILEAVAGHSNEALFELILIKPQQSDEQTDQILQSLEGDITILAAGPDENICDLSNTAAQKARGKHLLFLDRNTAPKKGWLQALKKGISQHPSDTIFGAKIISRFNNIVHAGMVVDTNNCPVPAYSHLDKDFPKTALKREFQMIHHFAAVEKSFFLSLGGFENKSGRYRFMDLCLRARAAAANKEETILYLPDVVLVQADGAPGFDAAEDSIYFYSRWHGVLWETESDLYRQDGVSSLQLNAARMTRAIETAALK